MYRFNTIQGEGCIHGSIRKSTINSYYAVSIVYSRFRDSLPSVSTSGMFTAAVLIGIISVDGLMPITRIERVCCLRFNTWSLLLLLLLLLLLGLCVVLFLLLLLLLGGRGYWPMGLPQRVIIAWTSLQYVLRCLVLRAAGTHRGEGTNLVPLAMYVVVHSVVPRTPSQSLMPYQGVTIICQARSKSDLPFIKPVLNWANVCSPNILPTVRRTMIRLLIELLVR